MSNSTRLLRSENRVLIKPFRLLRSSSFSRHCSSRPPRRSSTDASAPLSLGASLAGCCLADTRSENRSRNSSSTDRSFSRFCINWPMSTVQQITSRCPPSRPTRGQRSQTDTLDATPPPTAGMTSATLPEQSGRDTNAYPNFPLTEPGKACNESLLYVRYNRRRDARSGTQGIPCSLPRSRSIDL